MHLLPVLAIKEIVAQVISVSDNTGFNRNVPSKVSKSVETLL